MNKDQVAGRAKDMAGKAKAAVGRGMDKPQTEAKGRAQQVAGKAQAAAGDLKEQARKH